MTSAVMLNPCPLRFGSFAEAQKFFAREAQLFPVAGKITIHQMVREHVVPGRHGCVCREDGALADQLAGFGMGTNPFEQIRGFAPG